MVYWHFLCLQPRLASSRFFLRSWESFAFFSNLYLLVSDSATLYTISQCQRQFLRKSIFYFLSLLRRHLRLKILLHLFEKGHEICDLVLTSLVCVSRNYNTNHRALSSMWCLLNLHPQCTNRVNQIQKAITHTRNQSRRPHDRHPLEKRRRREPPDHGVRRAPRPLHQRPKAQQPQQPRQIRKIGADGNNRPIDHAP